MLRRLHSCGVIGEQFQFMPQEIERKFLIRGDFASEIRESFEIRQGYLVKGARCTARVRIADNRGFLTIKGPVDQRKSSCISRFEWEKEIPMEDAEELMLLCEPGRVEKTRCHIPVGKHTFEIDIFHGDNDGLMIAEIELEHEDEPFERPNWLGEEVTHDSRYHNSVLAHTPYRTWPKTV